MKTLLPVILMIVVNLGTGFARQRVTPLHKKAIIVAFVDEDRLKASAEGRTALDNFNFFLNAIQTIAKREFPDIEFKILKGGELLRLPDGTGLNVQNLQPSLGYVFFQQGKKRRMLTGPQSDKDFACAAAAFFGRITTACSK
ncbi:MAG TPA: hypothetical protein VGK48_15065 [Terriglobia bacterium]|jgi:hypothetical protein